MNHDKRKEMRNRAAARLKKARSFVLVTFDLKSEPVYSFDVSALKDPDDSRHLMMHSIANLVEAAANTLHERAEKAEAIAKQTAKAEEAKEKRSEELSKVA